MTSSYLNESELEDLGLKEYGEDVKISDTARIYNPEQTSIGDNVRIDDFTLLTGEITIGSHVHIPPFSSISGSQGVVLEDFASLSTHNAIFTVTGNYTGASLSNPTIPDEYKPDREMGEVRLCKHAMTGSHTVILPNVTIHEGGAVGAKSLVNDDIPEWTFCMGSPAKQIQKRDEDGTKELEQMFNNNYDPFLDD